MMDEEYEYDVENDEKSSLKNACPEINRKPRVKTNWDNKDTLKLINMVKREGCIWNSDDADYANRLLRKAAWSRVGAAFNGQYSDYDLHTKWSSLQIQYRMNHRKTKNTWKFLKTLFFLGPINKSSVSGRNVEASNSFIESSHDSVLEIGPTHTKTPITSLKAATSAAIRSSKSGHLTTAAPTSSLECFPEKHRSNIPNRDEALMTYFLSELRSMSESDTSICGIACSEHYRSLMRVVKILEQWMMTIRSSY